MAKGGARPGAGRKKGSKNSTPRLRDHLKPKDIADFVKHVLEHYKTDTRLAVWVGDHIFGKAPQPISGDPDGEPIVTVVKYAHGDKPST